MNYEMKVTTLVAVFTFGALIHFLLAIGKVNIDIYFLVRYATLF